MAGIWLCVCALLSAAFFTSTSASAPHNDSPIGQRVKAEINDSGVQSAAVFAAETVSVKWNTILNLVQITKAEVQAVAGLKYYLSAKIEFQGKGLLPDTMKSCDFVVHDRPWIPEKALLEYTCDFEK